MIYRVWIGADEGEFEVFLTRAPEGLSRVLCRSPSYATAERALAAYRALTEAELDAVWMEGKL